MSLIPALVSLPADHSPLSLFQESDLKLAISQPSLDRFLSNTDANLQKLQQSLCSYAARTIQQINEAMRKPTAERLKEMVVMQGASISPADAFRNIICALFHETVIIPIINDNDRSNLRINAMEERYLSRCQRFTVNDRTLTKFTLHKESLCTESLAFFFRFRDMFDASKLSQEHINFMIEHRDEIKDDLKTYLADLITHYECVKLRDKDISEKDSQVLIQFNEKMRFQSQLKRIFESACPIGSSLMQQYNSEIEETIQVTINKRKGISTAATLEKSNRKGPLFNLWVKVKDCQLALFNAACTELNKERAKSKQKIVFLQKYSKDPYGLVADQLTNYPKHAAELLTRLKVPYILEGDLERAFLSKKVVLEEKESEDKQPAAADAAVHQNKARVKKSKAAKVKQGAGKTLEDHPQTSSSSTSVEPSVAPSDVPSIAPSIAVSAAKSVAPSVAPPQAVVRTKKFPYGYAPRVRDWFTPSPSQLSSSSYDQLSEAAKSRQWAYHGFSREVDQFVLTYAIEGTRTHEVTGDIEPFYCIPGEINFDADGRNERGLFTFTINKNNELYHRYFTIATPDQILATCLEKTFYNIDFPKMIVDAEEMQDIPVELPNVVSKVTVNSLTEAVTIHDVNHNMRITLFKLVL